MATNLEQLITHPERMDRETLYDLRSLLALYPYFQTARLLMLKNLYILHDPSFDEELRRAAIYLTDRKALFELVEAAHYKIRNGTQQEKKEESGNETESSRTISLIDRFLDSQPEKEEKEKKQKRKPTPADAAIDYVSYLLETESEEEKKETEQNMQMNGLDLIDNFINKEGGRIELKENPEYIPVIAEPGSDGTKDEDEGYFTETLARIYIKQGRYSKALEIIKRLNLNYPKKNAYFADQIRFLEKLIINNKYK